MSAILPIDVDDLLRNRSIESVRVEFKAGWNPDTGYQSTTPNGCSAWRTNI